MEQNNEPVRDFLKGLSPEDKKLSVRILWLWKCLGRLVILQLENLIRICGK